MIVPPDIPRTDLYAILVARLVGKGGTDEERARWAKELYDLGYEVASERDWYDNE